MPSNQSPTLTLTRAVSLQGVFPSRDNPGGDPLQVLGAIRTYAFNFSQSGTVLAQGQLLPIQQYAALFALYGTMYGGDGRTTFAMPNLGGRLSVSQGQAAGLRDYAQGAITGSNTITLTQTNLPTDRGGSSVQVDNVQETLATRWMINVSGVYPSQSSTPLDMIGAVTQFGGNFAPAGMMECAGQLLNISEYTALFTVIGTTYGGDGQTTFALPDLRGRSVVGVGNGLTLGQTTGSENITLTNGNLPTSIEGGGAAVSNQGPALALNYLIATQGIFPSRDANVEPDPQAAPSEDTASLGEVIAFAGNFAPGGYMLANGQLLPIAQNQALFALLGTQFGGNGVTTFALPDLRARSILGTDSNHVVGQVDGSTSFTIVDADIPSLSLNGTAAGETLRGANQADLINGNDGNDTLKGFGGNDTLNGGNGDDVLIGGSGNNTLNGGDGIDTASYAAAITGVRIRLGQALQGDENNGFGGVDTLSNIENITGSDFNDYIIGDGGANTLFGGLGYDQLAGGGGNDILVGGTGTPNELIGGDGDDTYIVSANDTLVELANGGRDTVTAMTNTFVLSANIEDLTFGGSGAFVGIGNGENNVITGGTGADTLSGLGGNDTLYGGTGAANTLIGGLGDDVYMVRTAGDTIVEAAGQGTDTVDTDQAVHVLAANVENLRFSGAGAFVGTGNGDANTITGGTGADILSGLGGADTLIGGSGAANTLIGGLGDDIYVVSAFDTIIEASGEGTDTVQTTLANWALAANIENLTFTGSGAFVGYGNAAANVLTGGTGNDVLIGGGGDDTLNGGGGNDVSQFTGSFAQYIITDLGGGSYRVQDTVGGRDGTDVLNSIEYLYFGGDQRTVVLNTGAAAEAGAIAGEGSTIAAFTVSGDLGSNPHDFARFDILTDAHPALLGWAF